MLCNKTLIQNKRYMFLVKAPHKTKYFRANFKDIINNTLRVTLYQEENSIFPPEGGIHYIPKDWIAKVESLQDILNNEPVLIDDILISIDQYV